MKYWLSGWRLPVVILSAIALIGICGLGFSIVLEKKAAAGEIKNWDFGKKATGVMYNPQCPLVGRYPIRICLRSTNAAFAKGFQSAIKRWNELGEKIGVPQFFNLVPCDAPKGGYSKGEGFADVVVVKEAPEAHAKCAKPSFANNRDEVNEHVPGDMGWTTLEWTFDVISKGQIQMCTQKIEHTQRLVKTKAGKYARVLGYDGYLFHEMGHLIIGPAHLKYGIVMSARPKEKTVSGQLIKLLKERVVKVCQKNNRLSLSNIRTIIPRPR